jgi:hypothetical protein
MLNDHVHAMHKSAYDAFPVTVGKHRDDKVKSSYILTLKKGNT